MALRESRVFADHKEQGSVVCNGLLCAIDGLLYM
jgi:hypothetical protein